MKVGRADEIRPGGIKAPAVGIRQAALYLGKMGQDRRQFCMVALREGAMAVKATGSASPTL